MQKTAKAKTKVTSQEKIEEVMPEPPTDGQQKSEWESSIEEVYEKSVHWRRNLFQLPKEKTGTDLSVRGTQNRR